MNSESFLGDLRKNLQYAIQWLPKGAIKPNQVQSSDTVGKVLTTTRNGSEWQDPSLASTIVDAKGDLIVGTADDTVARRAVPADGWGVVADSSQSDGWRNELLARQQDLDDMRDEFEGHHHDGRYLPSLRWTHVFQAGGHQAAGAGANTYVLGTDDSGGNLTGTGTSTAPVLVLTASDYDIPGYTTQIRMVGSVLNNAVDAGCNFTITLNPITAVAGGVGVISYTAGSALCSVPALNSVASGGITAASTPVTLTSGTNYYVACYTTDATMAASSWVRIDARVEIRHVKS